MVSDVPGSGPDLVRTLPRGSGSYLIRPATENFSLIFRREFIFLATILLYGCDGGACDRSFSVDDRDSDYDPVVAELKSFVFLKLLLSV